VACSPASTISAGTPTAEGPGDGSGGPDDGQLSGLLGHGFSVI
jgi:hypothetical protein